MYEQTLHLGKVNRPTLKKSGKELTLRLGAVWNCEWGMQKVGIALTKIFRFLLIFLRPAVKTSPKRRKAQLGFNFSFTWACFFFSSSSLALQAAMRSANWRLLISKSSWTFSTSTCFLSSKVDCTVLRPVSSSLLADYKLEKNKKNYIQNLRNKEIGVKTKQQKLWKKEKHKTRPTLKRVFHFLGTYIYFRSVVLGKVLLVIRRLIIAFPKHACLDKSQGPCFKVCIVL